MTTPIDPVHEGEAQAAEHDQVVKRPHHEEQAVDHLWGHIVGVGVLGKVDHLKADPSDQAAQPARRLDGEEPDRIDQALCAVARLQLVLVGDIDELGIDDDGHYWQHNEADGPDGVEGEEHLVRAVPREPTEEAQGVRQPHQEA